MVERDSLIIIRRISNGAASRQNNILALQLSFVKRRVSFRINELALGETESALGYIGRA